MFLVRRQESCSPDLSKFKLNSYRKRHFQLVDVYKRISFTNTDTDICDIFVKKAKAST